MNPDIARAAPLGERRRDMLADAHYKMEFCRAQLCDKENRLYSYNGLLYSKETGEPCLLAENPFFNISTEAQEAAVKCDAVRHERERELNLPESESF